MRGRKKQSTTSAAAAGSSKAAKEKGASKEPEAREAGREPLRERLRRRGKEKATGGERQEPAREKQGKGKGKQKEVEVREDGQRNGREKETTAAGNVRPQFFKVFFPEQSGERLVSELLHPSSFLPLFCLFKSMNQCFDCSITFGEYFLLPDKKMIASGCCAR